MVRLALTLTDLKIISIQTGGGGRERHTRDPGPDWEMLEARKVFDPPWAVREAFSQDTDWGERGARGGTHHTTPHIIKMSGQECVKDSTPHYIRDTFCLTLFLTGGVFIHYQSANTSEMMDPHHGINIISKVLTTALEKSPDSTIYYRQPVPVQCYHIPDHYIVGIDNSWQWT